MKAFLRTLVLIVFAFFALASATTEEQIANIKNRCASFGHAYGSDGMARCVERTVNQNDRNSAKTAYCLNAFPLGSPAYFACLSR
jgi:hypothetical protein